MLIIHQLVGSIMHHNPWDKVMAMLDVNSNQLAGILGVHRSVISRARKAKRPSIGYHHKRRILEYAREAGKYVNPEDI